VALTKVGKEGITGISNSSDATAITIDSSENVGIGTTGPNNKLDVNGGIVCSPNTDGKDTFELSTSAVDEGRLRIKNVDSTTVEIRAGSASYFTGGGVGIGVTSIDKAFIAKEDSGSAGYCFEFINDGNNANRYGGIVQCGTDDASGTNYLFVFRDGDGTSQGYITFTSGTVSYGAFTAHHPCILPNADNTNGYPYGTLLETTSISYTQKGGADTERGILYNVQKTQSANSRAVLGVYAGSMVNGPDEETNMHQAAVLGDGHILCNNAGGNIAVGDGICSSATAGIGQKATANPSMIIGIAQEAVTFSGSETKLVPVQYGLQQFIPWS
tara:strand:+ start:54 stop:1037 length:984 start_codon:yes stop_codon:yes gene_type:complete